MRKLAFLLLLATSAYSQTDLYNYIGKTSRQITNVTHLQRMDTTFFKTRIGDPAYAFTRAFERRGLTPYDFNNNFRTLALAMQDRFQSPFHRVSR